MSLAARLAALKARKAATATNRPADPPPVAPDLDQRLRGARIVVVDTETTSKLPHEARIVEVALVEIILGGDAEPRVIFSRRVNPGEPIPEGASKIHGITDADVVGCPTWAEVWPEVAAATQGAIPAAFNAPYDHRVIAAECARAGVEVGPLAWGRWIDPLVLARGIDKFESGKKLGDVARRRGIDLHAHGGAGDAMATAMLTSRLILEAVKGKRHRKYLFRAPEYPTLRTWTAWQRTEALAQEREQISYLRNQGRIDSLDAPWHELEGEPLPAGAAASTAPRPVQSTACSYCGAPMVWVVSQSGQRHPCDPEIVTAIPQAEVIARRDADLNEQPPGKRVGLVMDDGSVKHGYLDPSGSLSGRVSHWITCPQASRVKADQAAKRGAA